jgi:hypothetical protein
MRTGIESNRRSAEPVRPAFDGFPSLVTRLSPAFYHITLLPAGLPRQSLREIAAAQAHVNKLETCLVLAGNCCYYFGGKYHGLERTNIPAGGPRRYRQAEARSGVPAQRRPHGQGQKAGRITLEGRWRQPG